MKSTLLFLPLLATLICCQAEKEPAVSLTVTLASEKPSEELELFDYSSQVGFDLLNPLETYQADSSGSYHIELDSVAAGMYALQVDGKSIPVILYEGVKMEVKGDLADLKSLSFEGKGAAENRFNQDFDPYPSKDLQVYGKLSPAEFVSKVDSSYQAGLAEIDAADSLNSDFLAMEKALLAAKRSYFVSYYPTLRKRLEGPDADAELPANVEGYIAEASKTADAGLQSPAYRNVVSTIDQLKFNDFMNDFSEKNPDLDWDMDEYIAQRKDFILKEEDEQLQDFLLAKLSLDAISYYGEEASAVVYDAYQEKFPHSPYRPYLEDVKQQWEALAKGKPGKEVEGKAPDGSGVKLSDFKGKVVYLDTWATWCGPCRGEFPSAKVLKEEYKDNDQVVFMYASIDSDKDAWEKYLANDPEFKGVHLYVDGAWQSELCQDYMIRAIPRYILFDKEGNIADAKAPRPSSGEEIREAINSLL